MSNHPPFFFLSLPSKSAAKEKYCTLINRHIKVLPDTEDKEKSLYAWFIPRTASLIGAPRIPHILSSIQAIYGPKTWGAVGIRLCHIAPSTILH